MLGSPPPSYFGVNVDRLRSYIPPPYLPSPKLIPPPVLSPARSANLHSSSLSPRSSRLATNTNSSGSDAMSSGFSRRRHSSDLKTFLPKTNSKESPSTPSSASSSSSSLSLSSSQSTPVSSPPMSSSSSSVSSFPSPYPPTALFPGLGLNPMNSALALKMGMLKQTQHPMTNNVLNKLSDEALSLPKHSSKTLFNAPHPYLMNPFRSSLQPSSSSTPPSSILSSPPLSSSSSSSSPSSAPLNISTSPLFAYPKFFTSFLTQEEQQQYMAMVNLQHAASSSKESSQHGLKNTPFPSRNYLELAMLVCNTFRGKLFPCPHCRYVTDRRNNLKRHVATMHQACDKQLECCGVTFATKASLREHIAIFHHNGYSCTFCGRRFCRKALLKRHLSVHNGQKDYTCPHCDYATSHKSNLERHKRIHARLPENGDPLVFPDASIDDDVINDDDYKPENIKMMSSSADGLSSGGISLPYFYDRLHKSFPGSGSATFSVSGEDKSNRICGGKALMHNPYYLKDKNERNSDFARSNHVRDLVKMSIPDIEAEEDVDDSDSDIDIDSLDDTDHNISEKSTDVIDQKTFSEASLYDMDTSNDDVRPLNLVKVRQEN